MEEDKRHIISPNSDDSGCPPINLRPRHQPLISTPFGPIKRWAELGCIIKLFFVGTILSLIVVIGLIISNLVEQCNEDFTVSLIQLIGAVFCIYYITRGILQDNRNELGAFIVSILLEITRSIVNYAVLADELKPEILPRFAIIVSCGFVLVAFSLWLMINVNMMPFRVSGALEEQQLQYKRLIRCISLLTFDLQAQLCLSVLVLFSGVYKINLLHSVLLSIGLIWACIKVSVGIIGILREIKCLVWIFLLQNIPELAYLCYLLYKLSVDWGSGESYTLEATAVVGSIMSVTIKVVLSWHLYHVYRSFGQGLRERMFSSYDQIDS
ncbi:Hypothetical predicted protein [Pelobates cultripes]|uniref:DUF7789 domain-containing protein n=1 Tax=Pelobates cultripes TaxID=61616 RepID=A0AAD1T6B0_PELCU|nr:Hypothetical predicted protein [Pelobates cultripes]